MLFKIIHDLSKLEAPALKQYLREVSVFVKLDPDMELLDTIWMQNENGQGQSLVVYARRGTAEILRQIHAVNTDSLTHEEVAGSIVFTAKGHDGSGRTECATGAKYIELLAGKARDNAIMTASTRALRRLTMQFTGLGILDESEVHAVEPNAANAAAAVTLAPAIVAPSVSPNAAPGKVVLQTKINHVENEITQTTAIQPTGGAAPVVPTFGTHREQFISEAQKQANETSAKRAAQKADIPADITPSIVTPKPVESTTSEVPVADISADKISAPKTARKPRKARNSVTLGDVEPETVSAQANSVVLTQVNSAAAVDVAPIPAPAPTPLPAPVAPAVPVQTSASTFEGKPTDAQMADYRKRVSVFTAELPSSENMGSVQKMRAFITKSAGAAPQFMTTEQWDEMIGWLEAFHAKNGTKGLVENINAALGVK